MSEFIALNSEQEDAFADMYQANGYQLAMLDTLSYLENTLGKSNIHTVN